MPRNLVALNVAFAVVAALLLVYIARQLVAPMPLPVGGRRAATPVTTPTATDPPRPPASTYNVVAARNLFSPTRTEAPASSTVIASTPVAKPNLFGVVVRESGSIAYLEDPATKRVAGYRVGDRIQGGTVQAIKSDAVMIDAPGGAMDVRLHDPGKPRAATAAVAPQPSMAPALPGVIPAAPPPAAPAPGVAAPAAPHVAQPPIQPGQPPIGIPGQPPAVSVPNSPTVTMPPVIPGRRPLPPNLLRRIPPGMGDAPQQ